MKISLTKEKLFIETKEDILRANEVNHLGDIIKILINGFVEVNNKDSKEKKANIIEKTYNEPKIALQNTNDDCGIRERLPNDISELDKNTIDMTKIDTKQLPMKQYKNFRCPSCGQSSLIKTLGELQSYCFRDLTKDGATLLQINNNHMESIINYHKDNDIKEPISKTFINSTNPNDKLYSLSIIEETDIAITTDGTLECECLSCNEIANFDKWYDAFKNTNKYFEIAPCYICGNETLPIIKKDNNVIQCENENCKHICDESFKVMI